MSAQKEQRKPLSVAANLYNTSSLHFAPTAEERVSTKAQQQRPRLCTSTDIIKHQSRQSIAETEGVVRGSILSPRMPFFFGEAVAHASGLQSAVSRVTLILVRNEFFPTFFALANNK